MLPDDILFMIWSSYFKNFVCSDIVKRNSIWKSPSNTLCNLTKDVGVYQGSFSDLVLLVDHHLRDMYNRTHDIHFRYELVGCLMCHHFKFPCISCNSKFFDSSLFPHQWSYV